MKSFKKSKLEVGPGHNFAYPSQTCKGCDGGLTLEGCPISAHRPASSFLVFGLTQVQQHPKSGNPGYFYQLTLSF